MKLRPRFCLVRNGCGLVLAAWVSAALVPVPGLGQTAAPAPAEPDPGGAPVTAEPDPFTLSRQGTPGLALRLFDQRQADPAADPLAWWQVELQRLGLLNEWRQWRRGAERLGRLPEGLPADIVDAAATLRVRFLLEDGDGTAARAALREVFWQRADAPSANLAQWRRLLIRSYLADHLVAEAEIATRRYQQDYPEPGADWNALRARVLLQAGRPGDALPLLRESASGDPDPLVLMAELRGEVRATEAVYTQAEEQARNAQRIAAERALFWLIAADAATRQGSTARIARAYDEAYRLLTNPRRLAEYYPVDGDALWQAYENHGERVGNSLRLLIGNDPAWFEQVSKALPRYPVRARALLATLARTSLAPETREEALARLARLLVEETEGMRLVKMLFLNSSRYPQAADIPVPVRYLLLDDALNRADISLASRLMATLSKPPEGADAFRWGLRRARVLVMGGEVEAGAAALGELVRASAEMAGPRLDRIMQVLFDLQAVGAHAQALDLLGELSARSLPPERRREILFWMADSHKALGRYDEAAVLYLRSAGFLDGQFGDPWGQTARYNAAEALAEAGLVDDARRLYRELLRLTEDPNRQSVLRQKLQQLWLRAAAPDNVAPPAR